MYNGTTQPVLTVKELAVGRETVNLPYSLLAGQLSGYIHMKSGADTLLCCHATSMLVLLVIVCPHRWIKNNSKQPG